MRWDDIDAFCLVVEHGGWTAATRGTGRPKSSLSASVTRLEAAIGARLLDRTTRSLRVTEAGESLYRDAQPALSQLREAASNALAHGLEVHGTLRIAAPYEFGAHHLASVACRLMAAHPRLTLRLDVAHGPVALHAGGHDIVFAAVEHTLPASASVVTRRVATLERGLYAAPALLARHAPPEEPGDLAAWPLLAGADETAWDFAGGASLPLLHPVLRSGNASVRRDAAIAGLGVLRVTATFAADAVAAGSLVPLRPDWRCAPLSVHALLPSRRLPPAKTRAFLALLAEETASA